MGDVAQESVGGTARRVPTALGDGILGLGILRLGILGLGILALAPQGRVGGQATADAGSDSATVVLEYIAHAAVRIHSPGGQVLLIDPYADRVWLSYDFPPEALENDAVLITHPHYDHDAGEFRGRSFPWSDEIPVLREPGRYRVSDFELEGVEGKHADPYGKEFGQINTLWIAEVGGIRFVHLGDNGPLTEDNVRALGRVDVLLMPGDELYHILSEEETRAVLEALRPKVVVPIHYRLPDLEPGLDTPSDLGPIDPWLEGRTGIVRWGTHRVGIRATDLPDAREIWVLEHSPLVVPPGGGI